MNSNKSYENNNKQNKTRCGVCQGDGIVKNINMFCDICEGIKCKYYTGNLIDYVPYEFCMDCNSTGFINTNTNNLNDQLIDKEKKSCNNCLGIGYVKKDKIICNFCNVSHKMCYCHKFTSRYVECDNCYGSGSLTN